MKSLLDEVLARIKPSAQEEKEIVGKTKGFIEKIQKSLPQCKVILGGSGQKGTWLREAHDFDIFVQFPAAEYKEKNISDILEKKLQKLFTVERLHGSRDYFQTTHEGYTFEIVPIIKISKADKAFNITDASPLHAQWVKKHKQYADEIRLTKQFFKAAKVYGAESYIAGFSGYICEVLTIHYKGFSELVSAVAKWKPKVVIDTEQFYKGKNVLFELNKAKSTGPLIVIDPIQESRNAAAAVSEEKFAAIVSYAKAFVKKPSEDFFDDRPIDVKELTKKAKNNHLFMVRLTPLAGKGDIIGCKLVKCYHHILQRLQEYEFDVIDAQWEWIDDALLYFTVDGKELDEERVVSGPPAKRKSFADDFRKKHKDVFEKKEILYAREKRAYRTPDALFASLARDNYIKERAKKISIEKIK